MIPVNPRESEILGERSYPSLSDVPEQIDVVDVFRTPDAVPAIAEEAVAVGAGALWLQFGVISPEGAEIARRGGLAVVMDRCLKVEHARYLGRMHWLGFNTDQITRAPRHGQADVWSGRAGNRRLRHESRCCAITIYVPHKRTCRDAGHSR